MSTANYINPTPITDATGLLLWLRIRQPNGTTAGEAAVPERTTPVAEGVYPIPTVPFTLQDGVAADAEYTVEVRACPTQDAAGFASSSSRYVAGGAFTVSDGVAVNDGGGAAAPAGTTTFRFSIVRDDTGAPYDRPGLTGVTVPAGIFVQGSSTPLAGTVGFAFTHDGTGTWGGPTITDAAFGLTYAYTLRLTFADGHTEDVPQVADGSESGTTQYVPPVGYPTTTNATLFIAQKTLLALMTAASTNPGGVVRVNVDGQEVQYANATDLQSAIQFWQRQVAFLSGTRRRTFGIRLDNF